MTIYGSQIVQGKLKFESTIIMDAFNAALKIPEEPKYLFCKPQALAEIVDVFRKACQFYHFRAEIIRYVGDKCRR